MLGWRGRIGYVTPGPGHLHSQEWDKILPEGVAWVVVPLGIRSLTPEEFERIFDMYLLAGEMLTIEDVNIIVCGGSPVHFWKGYEKSLEMARHMQEATGVPVILEFTTIIDALSKLAAKKIVVVTPFEEERNEDFKINLQKVGFDVLNIKGLGVRGNEISKLPSYAAYRLAREAFREAPQADAIYIQCPAWEMLSTIDTMERDFGKPVVADIAAKLWAALTALSIKGPIKGYGKLLEML